MSTPPQNQVKSYIGFTPTGGNPSYRTQRSSDQGRLGGAPLNIGNDQEEISIYAYLFRNLNAAAVYINIFALPAEQVKAGSIPIGRIEIPGTSNPPNQLIGPMLFTPYYYGQAGMSMTASTIDADGSAVGNAPASPVYFELVIA